MSQIAHKATFYHFFSICTRFARLFLSLYSPSTHNIESFFTFRQKSLYKSGASGAKTAIISIVADYRFTRLQNKSGAKKEKSGASGAYIKVNFLIY